MPSRGGKGVFGDQQSFRRWQSALLEVDDGEATVMAPAATVHAATPTASTETHAEWRDEDEGERS